MKRFACSGLHHHYVASPCASFSSASMSLLLSIFLHNYLHHCICELVNRLCFQETWHSVKSEWARSICYIISMVLLPLAILHPTFSITTLFYTTHHNTAAVIKFRTQTRRASIRTVFYSLISHSSYPKIPQNTPNTPNTFCACSQPLTRRHPTKHTTSTNSQILLKFTHILSIQLLVN